MKTLTIGGKEYKIEYSFEASEYKNCIDMLLSIISGEHLIPKNEAATEDETDKKNNISIVLSMASDLITNMPNLVSTLLYAGLLEHNPIESEKEAKLLIRQFIKENPGDEKASYAGIQQFLMECLEDDGFFKLTGLDKLIDNVNSSVEEQTKNSLQSTKILTDHKKKSTSTK